MYQPPFREIYLTEVSEVGLPIQKSKYAIRIVREKGYLTQFDTKEQVDGWCKLLGVSMKETPHKPKYFPDGTKMYQLNKTVQRFTLEDKINPSPKEQFTIKVCVTVQLLTVT